jgi:cytochrome P450
MHRRPDLYGMDAELFRPERWEEDMPMHRDATKAKWGYLPFHGGPRTCLGSESNDLADLVGNILM